MHVPYVMHVARRQRLTVSALRAIRWHPRFHIHHSIHCRIAQQYRYCYHYHLCIFILHTTHIDDSNNTKEYRYTYDYFYYYYRCWGSHVISLMNTQTTEHYKSMSIIYTFAHTHEKCIWFIANKNWKCLLAWSGMKSK